MMARVYYASYLPESRLNTVYFLLLHFKIFRSPYMKGGNLLGFVTEYLCYYFPFQLVEEYHCYCFPFQLVEKYSESF